MDDAPPVHDRRAHDFGIAPKQKLTPVALAAVLSCAPTATTASWQPVSPPPAPSAALLPASIQAPDTASSTAPHVPGVPEWIRRALGSMALPSAEHTISLDDSPNVVVTRTGVFLDGACVAAVPELAATGKVVRVEALFARLDAMRKALQKANAGSVFPGSLNYWIDAYVPALVVKSVIETAVSAGYPYGAFVVRKRGLPDGFGRLLVDASPPLPTADIGATTGLPADTIQRVARQNYAMFRDCYLRGRRRNPALEGRVSVWFVIGVDGRVAQALDGGSTLRDPEVIRCVVEAFRGLVFPAPPDSVTVVYPFLFEPGVD